jgi:signal transduction histidine kinase
MVTYPVKDHNGEIIRVLEIWRDITDELSSRWENRVKALKDDLSKLVQEDRMISLGRLAASCVHEINNPIQGLMTFSHLMLEMLKRSELSRDDLDEFRRYLSLMSNELERCGNIISGLLSFSRQPVREYKDVDLHEILEAVIGLTRHKMELQDIRLRKDFCPGSLIVRGDLNQLQQCLLNLIFNAIEAMPQGGELSVISEVDRTRAEARIEIRDTGCGIGERDLENIFDPFFTTKEDGEGTGLGLSIVYGVVKMHHGEIKVKSQADQGSSFTLHLPLHRTRDT